MGEGWYFNATNCITYTYISYQMQITKVRFIQIGGEAS